MSLSAAASKPYANLLSQVLVGVGVCLTAIAAVSCADPYAQSTNRDGVASTLEVVESTTDSTEPVQLPAEFSLHGGLTVRIFLPESFEETPLARGTFESPDYSMVTAQSYGLPPAYDQSIVVSVNTGPRVTEQLVFNAESPVQTLNGVRSVPVYSWHDSDTGQEGMAFCARRHDRHLDIHPQYPT